MTHLPLILTIVGMGIITFGLRLFFIALAGQIVMPPLIERGLRYVPVAVLSAIVFPEVLQPQGTLDLSLQNPFIPAGLLAIVAAALSKNVFVTIIVGMGTLWIVQWLLTFF